MMTMTRIVSSPLCPRDRIEICQAGLEVAADHVVHVDEEGQRDGVASTISIRPAPAFALPDQA
jgi:hypothetical protein